MEPAGQQAEAQRALDLLRVAVSPVDLQHRGDAAAVFGRDRAFVELHPADDVVVEGGEDAEHVVRVVDRSAVEEDKILVGGAAADVEAAGRFAHRLDARQRHDDLQRVGLAEDHRHVLDDIGLHPLDAQLRRAVVHPALGRHHGAAQRHHGLLITPLAQRGGSLRGQVFLERSVHRRLGAVLEIARRQAVHQGAFLGSGSTAIDGHLVVFRRKVGESRLQRLAPGLLFFIHKSDDGLAIRFEIEQSAVLQGGDMPTDIAAKRRIELQQLLAARQRRPGAVGGDVAVADLGPGCRKARLVLGQGPGDLLDELGVPAVKHLPVAGRHPFAIDCLKVKERFPAHTETCHAIPPHDLVHTGGHIPRHQVLPHSIDIQRNVAIDSAVIDNRPRLESHILPPRRPGHERRIREGLMPPPEKPRLAHRLPVERVVILRPGPKRNQQ